MWLGAYVERKTDGRMHVWDGECHVHAGIRPGDIADVRAEHPDAEFLIHPECGCTTQVMEYVAAGDVDAEHTHMLSTGGMLKFAAELGRRRVHRRHRDRHALPARAGQPGQELRAGQPRRPSART